MIYWYKNFKKTMDVLLQNCIIDINERNLMVNYIPEL